MTDRELLELAAKAAGYTGFSGDDYQGPYFCIPSDPVIPRSEPKIFRWLTDDGDALRLAVRLGIRVYPPHDEDRVALVRDYSGLHVQEFGFDPDEITRRAIVRAAAAIGKTM